MILFFIINLKTKVLFLVRNCFSSTEHSFKNAIPLKAFFFLPLQNLGSENKSSFDLGDV